MEKLFDAVGQQDEPTASLVREVDAWASEVLVLRSDALSPEVDPRSTNRKLDSLFGAYVARDRLERVPGASDFLVVAALDALFESFTSEVGREWIALTGLERRAGRGWWWNRLPLEGPAREDFDDAVAAGLVEGPPSDD